VTRLTCALALVPLSIALAQPQFTAASVKPSPPGETIGSMNGGPLPTGPYNQSGGDPGRIVWTNTRLIRMIQAAYDFPVDRISAPDWLDSNCYNVTATLPPGTSAANFRLMLQNLLVERFHLAVHRATHPVSGYALEVAKGGLKTPRSKTPAELVSAANDRDAKPSLRRDEALAYMATRSPSFQALVAIDNDGFPMPRPGNPTFPPGAGFAVTIAVNGRNRSSALNQPMSSIAAFLGNLVGAPAEDRTGLTGNYDIRLEYVTQPDEPGPGVFDAVEQQLGLKLVSAKVPAETLVVDHADKVPAGN
jgi:uncharacterized protein (TIGR03435 family)